MSIKSTYICLGCGTGFTISTEMGGAVKCPTCSSANVYIAKKETDMGEINASSGGCSCGCTCKGGGN
ncbi:MAG: hypothetical protein L3V56_13030 [Candidatus Magnetoovum sp. WYHC-5]|nr:hypothetical protein [Candidatus Magnetoovum sp. WYHC-5]